MVATDNPSETHNPCLENRYFENTHWTIVINAAKFGSKEAEVAMGKLCEAYWRPLYAYLRRRGYKKEDAEDLIQGFAKTKLLKEGFLKNVSPERGKFRSWLLVCLQNYVAGEYEKQNAKIRGGGCQIISIDGEGAETAYLELPIYETPETIYEDTWARTLLSRVRKQLLKDYEENGKAAEIEVLEELLDPGLSHKVAGARLGKSEKAVTMSLSRLKRGGASLLRREIGRTVSSKAEVEEELLYLLKVLSR